MIPNCPHDYVSIQSSNLGQVRCLTCKEEVDLDTLLNRILKRIRILEGNQLNDAG